jgi:uncharacterized protein (DUF58 family)
MSRAASSGQLVERPRDRGRARILSTSLFAGASALQFVSKSAWWPVLVFAALAWTIASWAGPSMRAFWARWAGSGSGGRISGWQWPRIKVTVQGAWFLGVTIFIGLIAINTGANLLYLVFGMLLAGMVVSGVASSSTLRGMEVKRVLPWQVTANEPIAAGFTFKNHKGWRASHLVSAGEVADLPLSAESADAGVLAARIAPRGIVTVTRQIAFARRGRFRLNTIRVGTVWPFHFIRKFIDVSVPGELIVTPRRGRITGFVPAEARRNESVAAARSPEAADDLRSMREYRRGDNWRHIHWRSSARTGRLVIREFQGDNAFCGICIDPRTPTDAASLARWERGISFAATLFDRWIRDGRAFALWIPGACDLVVRPTSADEVGAAMRHLATLKPTAVDAPPFTPAATRASAAWVSVGASDPQAEAAPLFSLEDTVRWLDPASPAFDAMFTFEAPPSLSSPAKAAV